ncbi:hypothetical protein BON30_25585 [Cystobacter ferrugineus]|uniref:Uncharacterized protein n=1 Tax=Cystobacter ferrugineus TaxID=83449 RepID=A0A1L9B5P2_9BACT|nr:hypothetical protein BON30_25585 [Cystobacter ferrugineus]
MMRCHTSLLARQESREEVWPMASGALMYHQQGRQAPNGVRWLARGGAIARNAALLPSEEPRPTRDLLPRVVGARVLARPG